MARRRRRSFNDGPAGGPIYSDALEPICKMERAVIWRTVDFGDVRPDDFLYLLWPEDAINRLKAAHGLTSTGTMQFGLDDNIVPGCPHNMQIKIDLDVLCCLSPLDMEPQVLRPKWFKFVAAMGEIMEIRSAHNELRQVVRWFQRNAVTLGCARFNAPWLLSLLPKEHGIHAMNGEVYKHTEFPDNIKDMLRRAPLTVTKGLLADPPNAHPPEGHVITLIMGSPHIDGDHNIVPVL